MSKPSLDEALRNFFAQKQAPQPQLQDIWVYSRHSTKGIFKAMPQSLLVASVIGILALSSVAVLSILLPERGRTDQGPATSVSTTTTTNTATATATTAPADAIQFLQQQYDLVYHLYPSEYYLVRKYGTWVSGIVKASGEIVIPLEYDTIQVINLNRLIVLKDEKYGIIDMNRNIILPILYDYLECEQSEYNSRSVILVEDGQYYLANTDGVKVSNVGYDNLFYIGRNIEAVYAIKGEDEYWLDFQGNIIKTIPKEPAVVESAFGLGKTMRIKSNIERYGVQDQQGNTILPAEYVHVTILEDRILAERNPSRADASDGGVGIFDHKGRLISHFEYYQIDFYPYPDGTFSKYAIGSKYTQNDPKLSYVGSQSYLIDRDGKALTQGFDFLAFDEGGETLTGKIGNMEYIISADGNITTLQIID